MARPRHVTDKETVQKIVSDYTEGLVPTTQLAKTYGTTPSTISMERESSSEPETVSDGIPATS